MKEMGQIVHVESEVATVRIQRRASCGSCTACGMAKGQNEMYLKVANDLDAKLGDWVELDLKSVSFLKATTIIYLIPLISLIIGVIIGYFIAGFFSANAELYGAVGGISFTILSFLGIRVMDPRFSKSGEYSPKMVSIINFYPEGEIEDGK